MVSCAEEVDGSAVGGLASADATTSDIPISKDVARRFFDFIGMASELYGG
jgi:hypothetical protein